MSGAPRRAAVEVCVLGGGPAGCAAAARLAELGHRTCLVARADPVGPPTAESLPPSVVPILESMNLLAAVQAAVFQHEDEAWIRWGSANPQVKRLEPPGWLVLRPALEQQLRAHAQRAGAQLVHGTARSFRRRAAGGWLVAVDTPQGPWLVEAESLVDARGRRPAAAAALAGPRTVALSAPWRPGPGPASPTCIEAGAEAWFWGCPLPAGHYAATVFLDAAALRGLRGPQRQALYRQRLAQATLLAPLLDGERVGPATVRDATSRTATAPIEADLVRVGDAACAIDPLSSQGVQRALVSAAQAVAALHTLRTARDPAAALEFYRLRHAQAARRAAAHAAGFCAEAAQAFGSPFWTARAGTDEPRQARAPMRPANGPLPGRLKLSDAVRLVQVPVLDGMLIRYGTALDHPSLEEPAAFVEGMPAALLVGSLAREPAPEQLLAQWATHLPHQVGLRVLRWMLGHGLLAT